jgi:hypothetical protein
MRCNAVVMQATFDLEQVNMQRRTIAVKTDDEGGLVAQIGGVLCDVLPTQLPSASPSDASEVVARLEKVAVIADDPELIDDGILELAGLAADAPADAVLLEISPAEGLAVEVSVADSGYVLPVGSDEREWLLVPHGTMFDVEVSVSVKDQEESVDIEDNSATYFVFGVYDGEVLETVPVPVSNAENS